MRWRSPIRRSGPGTYVVTLASTHRDMLRTLPGQLRDALAANPSDPSLRRLFPPAYPHDPEAEAEYRRLMGSDLEERRGGALDTLARTADATRLSQSEIEAWLAALNDMRLWLGTLLDVSEDDEADDPEDMPHMLYQLLGALQELVVEALTEEM